MRDPITGTTFTGPLEFLSRRIRPEIASARDLWNEFIRKEGKAAESKLLSDHAHDMNCDLVVGQTDPEAAIRCAAAWDLCTAPTFDLTDCSRLISIAYQDPSGIVRGFAWRLIGRALSNSSQRAVAEDVALEFLVDEFRIAKENLAIALQVWLEGLEWECSRFAERVDLSEWYDPRVAREVWEQMLKSEQVTFACLAESDPLVRAGAIRLYRKQWTLTDAVLKRLMGLLKTDADSRVRLAVLHLLGHNYLGSRDMVIGSTIAEIVTSDGLGALERETAYQALCMIFGKPSMEWPVVKRALGTFSFPDDVDWALVGAARRS